MAKRRVVKLRIDKFMEAADEKGLTSDAAIAAAIGGSTTQVWRAKSGCKASNELIAGVLDAFGGTFEQFFFLE